MTGSRPFVLRAAIVTLTVMSGAGAVSLAAEPALKLNAAVVGATPESRLAIELFRWSTDTERAPLQAALAPAPAPAPAAPLAAGGRGGRAGRGGRGAGPPPSPTARLLAAIQAAPTVGFVWGDGPTGHSIKYAWRTALPDGSERVVLATDRRLGAHSTSWPAARTYTDAEFTVIEIRIGGKGPGEGKASLTTTVVVDAASKALALEGYEAAPVLFKVTR